MNSSPALSPDLSPPSSRPGQRFELVRDPLAPVLKLGRREGRIGLIVGLLGTFLLHGGPATDLMSSLADLREFAKRAREVVNSRLGSEVDLDMTKPPPPPPPPPPEPEPPPEKVAAPRPANEPPPPPPAPAEAAKVMTQEPDPNEPVDFTNDGFVTGNAERYAGGITSKDGTSKQAVRSAAATPTGVPGGTGTAPAPPPPAVDLSKPATHGGGSWNDCGFPAEADIEGINEAVVSLVVTVSPEGRAKSVSVVKDPGFGFGRLARDCAFRKPFSPGLDSYGKPVIKTTAPIRVHFTR